MQDSQYKPDQYQSNIIICDCKLDGINVASYSDDPDVWIQYWFTIPSGGFFYRLKYAWIALTHGQGCEIVLSPKDASQLVCDINSAIQRVGKYTNKSS